jgi:fatty-acid peroxygenase
MFMSLMSPEGIQQLTDMTSDQWRAYIEKWEAMDQVVLHEEAQEILCRAVCNWAGIPLTESEARQRTCEFGAMIDGAGAVGPRNWRGNMAALAHGAMVPRHQRCVRKLTVPEASATHVVAWHRDLDGELLDSKVAAVELTNVLRPTVAVAWFVTFAALALHNYPECRRKLEAGEDDYLEMFIQEVRRFYPFFPAVGGHVQKEFDWRGHHFGTGTWVLLDLYGTNHDARIWQEPEVFRPERFGRWREGPFNFIPQGGRRDYDTSHRCAGEWLTIELMKTIVRLLTTGMQYDVPEQDLRIALSRMPAIPASGFLINNVMRA